jgi:Esterase/lipase
MDFWPHWLSDLALAHNAIIISPNYRLMPEGTSAQVYEDIEDFWSWLHSSSLADLLASHSTPTEIDLNRILTAGESAGGLLSVYLALSHPTEIRAATAAYPAVDIGSDDYGLPRASPCFGSHVSESLIQVEESAAQIGTASSSITAESRLTYMLAILEHGKINGIYERGSEGVPRGVLYPMVKLEEPGVGIPVGGIAVIHGRQDSVVPVGGAERFVERAREVTKGMDGNEG